MFAPANQTHFALTIEGLSCDLQVLALQGREAISQPFVFEVELVSEQPSLDLETLLHKTAFCSSRLMAAAFMARSTAPLRVIPANA